MFSWNVLWSTVLILTVLPDEVWKAATCAASDFLGVASDEYEPRVIVPLADPPLAAAPPLLLLPQAARRPGMLRAAAPPTAPLNSVLRFSDVAATDVGTIRAKYSASDCGRDMVPPHGTELAGIEQVELGVLNTNQHDLPQCSTPFCALWLVSRGSFRIVT